MGYYMCNTSININELCLHHIMSLKNVKTKITLFHNVHIKCLQTYIDWNENRAKRQKYSTFNVQLRKCFSKASQWIKPPLSSFENCVLKVICNLEPFLQSNSHSLGFIPCKFQYAVIPVFLLTKTSSSSRIEQTFPHVSGQEI